MDKKLLLLLLLAMALPMVSAFSFGTSDTIDVYQKGIFYVEITNNTSELQDLEINFYSPTEVKINAPSKIAPNTNLTAQITVYNNYSKYREITSKLEVTLGNETKSKEINTRFYAIAGTADNPFTGLFGLGFFTLESSAFSLVEWGFFWVLVIVAAILIIALFARITHRI